MSPNARGLLVGLGGMAAGLLVGWLTSMPLIPKLFLVIGTSVAISMILWCVTKCFQWRHETHGSHTI
jgi:hypothetical protein